ncbi:MAG: hypothetical protein IPN86_18790 [Saprospiraceae bacterium]|nr:hypothetical protein [Saprospiraceae bacterium]
MLFHTIKPEGKKVMTVNDFLNGHRFYIMLME